MKSVPYLDQPCERCGSKRRVAKTWKEKIPTSSGGFTKVEYSQIVCTNKECQKEFEANLEKENQKREAIKKLREDKTKEREKTNRVHISLAKKPKKTPSKKKKK